MRAWIGTVLTIVLCLLGAGPAAAQAIEVTDIAGRVVKLARPAQRIVLGDSRYVHALAVLETGNPARRVVGMLDDLGRYDPRAKAELNRRWPETKDVALFGVQGGESVSAERIITLAPDVAVFGLADHGPGVRNRELIKQLEAAGVAIVFIDFRQDPLANTVRSVELLGAVLGAPERAKEFAEFYTARKERVATRVTAFKGERPRVFLQAHVGRFDCCVSMARGMLGPMVALAGGRNIAAEVSPGPTGRHTMEFLIAGNIDVFIGTASGTLKDLEAGKAMIVLGGGVDRASALRSLQRAVDQPGMKALPAMQSGRVHGIWHDFYNSPHNIYVLETFAKWLHPDLFADVDPEATLAELHRRFSPFDLGGTYAVSMERR